jgi:hypothetical protein
MSVRQLILEPGEEFAEWISDVVLQLYEVSVGLEGNIFSREVNVGVSR